MAYSKMALYTWLACLEELEMKYTMEEGDTCFIKTQAGRLKKMGNGSIVIACRESDSLVQFAFSEKVPIKWRRAVSELLTRINCQQWFGHFAMDHADGEVICRYISDYQGSVLSRQMAYNAVSFVLNPAVQWEDTIHAVMTGASTPEQAMKARK